MALAVLSGPVAAADAPPAGQRLLGEADFRWWGLPMYSARLSVAPGFEPQAFARHAFTLELEYRRSFTAQQIARRSLAEMQRAGEIDAGEAQRWEQALARILPNVRAGDRIAGVNRPGLGAEFFANGRTLGEITDVRFATLFFSIWLAPTTSEPALRAALLGEAK